MMVDVCQLGCLHNGLLSTNTKSGAKILHFFYIRKRGSEKKMNFKRISANCVNFYTFSGGTKRTKINRFIYVTQLLHMFYLLPFSYPTMGDSWVIHG